jgi:hypothetical protein
MVRTVGIVLMVVIKEEVGHPTYPAMANQRALRYYYIIR